ncbi:MAG: hypothetical protein WCS37_08460 [Chloroflexota bacterium]|nr:hypothetical protein [Chloroflexota bacterium]
MKKIYEPRYPTNNAGFVFLAISVFFILATLDSFVIVIANQHRRDEPGYGTFNWLFLIFALVLGVILFGLAMAGARRLLRNEPRRVTLEEERIVVEKVAKRNSVGIVEIEIPLALLLSVDQQNNILVSEAARGGAHFKVLLFQWQDDSGSDIRMYRLSERDVVEFDLLIEDIFSQIPEPAKGQRIFER